MKNTRFITLCLWCLSGVAFAAAPVKVPNSRYARLWTNSPFTVKPAVTTDADKNVVNPFEDLALGGVSLVNDGYFLVLLNKKEQGKKIIVEPGRESEYQVLEVRSDPLDPKKTEVVIQMGGRQGTVTYDEKLLAAAPKPVPQPGQRPPVPGTTQPPKPGQAVPATANPPRMRVVPTQGNQTTQPGSQPGSHTSGRSSRR